MSRAHTVVLLWALFLGILGVVAVTVFEPSDPETPALFGGMTLLMLLIGLYLLAARSGPADAGDRSPRVVRDVSVPSAWIAISLPVVLLGGELGTWLALIGGGMVLVGVAGLVREARAERDLRAATRRSAQAISGRGRPAQGREEA